MIEVCLKSRRFKFRLALSLISLVNLLPSIYCICVWAYTCTKLFHEFIWPTAIYAASLVVVQAMLMPDPKYRPSAAELLDHPLLVAVRILAWNNVLFLLVWSCFFFLLLPLPCFQYLFLELWNTAICRAVGAVARSRAQVFGETYKVSVLDVSPSGSPLSLSLGLLTPLLMHFILFVDAKATARDSAGLRGVQEWGGQGLEVQPFAPWICPAQQRKLVTVPFHILHRWISDVYAIDCILIYKWIVFWMSF